MAKKSTEYLTYIEERRKHHDKIAKIAQEATWKASKSAFDDSHEITYVKGDEIIQEKKGEKKKVIGKYSNNRRKVKVGSKGSLSKR